MPAFLTSRLLRTIFGASIVLLAQGCSSTTDEQQVHAVIHAAQVAAESRATSDVLDFVADDYVDAQGFDKAQLRNFLRGYFLSHPKIKLMIDTKKIEFETANRARVRVNVILIGTRIVEERNDQANKLLAGDAATLQLEFQRENSKWLVSRADRLQE